MHDPNDVWYFAKGNERFGPMTFADLLARKGTGELRPTDWVWRAGEPDWRRAGDVRELGAFSGAAEQRPEPRYGDPAYAAAVNDIPSYLWQAIAVTLLCCFLPGIPAIVYATKVDRMLALGDLTGARAASDSARTWCFVALILGIPTCGGLGLLWING